MSPVGGFQTAVTSLQVLDSYCVDFYLKMYFPAENGGNIGMGESLETMEYLLQSMTAWNQQRVSSPGEGVQPRSAPMEDSKLSAYLMRLPTE